MQVAFGVPAGEWRWRIDTQLQRIERDRRVAARDHGVNAQPQWPVAVVIGRVAQHVSAHGERGWLAKCESRQCECIDLQLPVIADDDAVADFKAVLQRRPYTRRTDRKSTRLNSSH